MRFKIELPPILLFVYLLFFRWTGFYAHDHLTWFLEISPSVIGIIFLVVMYVKYDFRFTNLTYVFVFIFCMGIAWGALYTFPRHPVFNYIREIFEWKRNHYDRIGHFFQGFVPALIVREIIIRKKLVNGQFWIGFFTVVVCLAVSVSYEFFEWWIGMMIGANADDFLGTQGDSWDTQWDMFLALIGSVSAVLLLSKIQDSLIKEEQS